VTLFMTLLASLQTLLYRYSGQPDIAVGTVVANRNVLATEGLIGFFVNTLVLRTDFQGWPNLLELLRRVRRTALDAYAHQDLPFEKLVEELQPARNTSRTPLFQVALVLQDGLISLPAMTGLEVETISIAAEAQFDLLVAAIDTGGAIHATFEYDTELFTEATIRRWAEHFRNLLALFASASTVSVDEADFLSADERPIVLARPDLETWRPSESDSLAVRFERQTEQTPDAPAVGYEGRVFSYAQLNAEANRLANYLRRQGVGPEQLVALCFDRTPALVIAILSVLKAGGAYVALDPVHPKERLAFMLQDAKVEVLVTDQRLVDLLPACGGKVFCLDTQASELQQESADNPTPVAGASNLAYVLYTSGSTGTPKGVMVEHRQVLRIFDATAPWFRFGTTDVWTLFHSFAFDFSVWELWGALLFGGKLVIVPYLVSRSPAEFRALLLGEGVTILTQTPSAFGQLMKFDAEAELSPDLPFRLAIFGGETLEFENLRSWVMQHGDDRPELINMYGITETTIHSTYYRVRADDLDGRLGSIIGRSIPDGSIYLLDMQSHTVPIGTPGEIYVSGHGVCRGYLNRPGLTAERFVPDPFAQTPGARLYRSGDRGRWRNDGNLEFLGRLDRQVKVRGMRLELGDVEAALLRLPMVRQAVTGLEASGSGEQQLAAWLTLNPGTTATPVEIRRALRAHLAEYMIPTSIAVLDEFPLTANGKVDRRALTSLAPVVDVLPPDFVAPRSALEQTLAGIWLDVLPVEHVSIHDNFFDLGGHSLTATQVASRISREFQITFPVRTIFQTSSLAELAIEVTQLQVGAIDMEMAAHMLDEIHRSSAADLDSTLTR
jgi:amino acid adenylation domain-containing protein